MVWDMFPAEKNRHKQKSVQTHHKEKVDVPYTYEEYYQLLGLTWVHVRDFQDETNQKLNGCWNGSCKRWDR